MLTIYAPEKNGGVTDYADNLQSLLSPERSEIKSLIRSTTLPSNNILLNYSGYGFEKRGAPLWLLKKIIEERKNSTIFGIYFHELYASGPITSSAFWLSPVQQHIARGLAKTSDFWITNLEGSAHWLRRFAGDKPHAVLPVFSNMGEMPTYVPERATKIIIFGSTALRSAAYRSAGSSLFLWAREQNFELHDIGPVINDPNLSNLLRKAGVIQHGRLESDEINNLLSDAMFGILAYSPNYAAKSSVLAAYCAHGVCPVLISEENHPTGGQLDGLISGVNYLAGIPIKPVHPDASKSIGSAAWQWYQPHRMMIHIETLERLLKDVNK